MPSSQSDRRNPQGEIDALRDYVVMRFATDFGVSDDVLDTLLAEALAWKRAGGNGGEWWKASEDLRRSYMPEDPPVRP
jgi:hypothetical protein